MSIMAFIAARSGSKRLPGKIFKNLVGKKVIDHIIDITKHVQHIDDLVILTTTLYEDEKIVEYCKNKELKCVVGSPTDVLDRFRVSYRKYKPDHIVRLTADNPLMDPEIIEKTIIKHIEGKYDLTSNKIGKTFPYGLDVEVIKSSIMREVWMTTDNIEEREHVTLYIYKNSHLFKIGKISNDLKIYLNIRLTLDTEEDFKLINIIYKNIYKGSPISFRNIIHFLNENPDLTLINNYIKQKTF